MGHCLICPDGPATTEFVSTMNKLWFVCDVCIEPMPKLFSAAPLPLVKTRWSNDGDE